MTSLFVLYLSGRRKKISLIMDSAKFHFALWRSKKI